MEPRSARGLAVEGLALRRGGQGEESFELRGLSLGLAGGELVTIAGPSGCGKSSLLLALAGLIPFTAGTLALDGKPWQAFSPAGWRARVGLAPAEPVMVEGSVAENLRLAWRFKAARGRARPDDGLLRDWLAAVGLEDLDPGADAGRLSTGQRQRVALVRHLLPRPDFLLLDEPSANLDPQAAKQVWQTLERFRAETGAGVVCVTHGAPPLAATRALRFSGGLLEEV